MKRLVLLLALAAVPALADIPPSNSLQCSNASAGAACTTDDGQAGTCTKALVGRPDYSDGFPPKVKQVEMLLCVASAKATVRTGPPLLAAGVVLLVMLGLMVTKLASRGRRGLTA